MFNPAHSPLELDPNALGPLIQLVEERIGHGVTVAGVVEFGSFAKHEAVPESDVDLRVYVRAPSSVVYNAPGVAQPESFHEYLRGVFLRTPVPVDWASANYPLWDEASDLVGCRVNLGLVDAGYARFLVRQVRTFPSDEPSILMQSTTLFDPTALVEDLRARLDTDPHPELVRYLSEAVRTRLTDRLPGFLRPHPADAHKAEDSGQILWVAHAVRCIRDAVAVSCYARDGTFVYVKDDVLAHVARHARPHLAVVRKLYAWKTDPARRSTLFRKLQQQPDKVYGQFTALAPAVADAVEALMQGLPEH